MQISHKGLDSTFSRLALRPCRFLYTDFRRCRPTLLFAATRVRRHGVTGHDHGCLYRTSVIQTQGLAGGRSLLQVGRQA